MKLVPTASQTVGPFFSIGLAPLYQQDSASDTSSGNTIHVRGSIYDGDRKPIPDAVLEFWSAGKFARVPTADDGTFSVSIERSSSAHPADVLIFMRGLLKPVYTRVYFGESAAFAGDSILKLIPEDRVATLFARPQGTPDQFAWDVVMQGQNETVFFEF